MRSENILSVLIVLITFHHSSGLYFTWDNQTNIQMFKTSDRNFVLLLFYDQKMAGLLLNNEKLLIGLNMSDKSVCDIKKSITTDIARNLKSLKNMMLSCTKDFRYLDEFIAGYDLLQPLIHQMNFTEFMTEMHESLKRYPEQGQFFYAGKRSISTTFNVQFKFRFERAIDAIFSGLTQKKKQAIVTNLDVVKIYKSSSVMEVIVYVLRQSLFYLDALEEVDVYYDAKQLCDILESFDSRHEFDLKIIQILKNYLQQNEQQNIFNSVAMNKVKAKTLVPFLNYVHMQLEKINEPDMDGHRRITLLDLERNDKASLEQALAHSSDGKVRKKRVLIELFGRTITWMANMIFRPGVDLIFLIAGEDCTLSLWHALKENFYICKTKKKDKTEYKYVYVNAFPPGGVPFPPPSAATRIHYTPPENIDNNSTESAEQ